MSECRRVIKSSTLHGNENLCIIIVMSEWRDTTKFFGWGRLGVAALEKLSMCFIFPFSYSSRCSLTCLSLKLLIYVDCVHNNIFQCFWLDSSFSAPLSRPSTLMFLLCVISTWNEINNTEKYMYWRESI